MIIHYCDKILSHAKPKSGYVLQHPMLQPRTATGQHSCHKNVARARGTVIPVKIPFRQVWSSCCVSYRMGLGIASPWSFGDAAGGPRSKKINVNQSIRLFQEQAIKDIQKRRRHWVIQWCTAWRMQCASRVEWLNHDSQSRRPATDRLVFMHRPTITGRYDSDKARR